MTNRRSLRWLPVAAVAIALYAPGCSRASDSKAAVSDVPRLEFEKYTLANGLDVILGRTTGCRWWP